MPQTIRTGLEQGRAKYAYECAEKGAALGKASSEYRAYAKKIPMMIKINGLGATLAFISSKNERYKLIYRQLSVWFTQSELIDFDGSQAFVNYVVTVDSSTYRAMTIETLAFFNWLRRFAEGLINEDS
jgi:CRISPR-associated protein Cmr5